MWALLTLLMSGVMYQVPFFRQKVADSALERGLVVWDYHVIAVERRPGEAQVYDPSRCPHACPAAASACRNPVGESKGHCHCPCSTLPCPCDIHTYARHGLGPASTFPWQRWVPPCCEHGVLAHAYYMCPLGSNSTLLLHTGCSGWYQRSSTSSTLPQIAATCGP